MNKLRYLLLALPLAMMIGYGCSESKNRLSASREADSADSAAEEVMENEETVEASQMPAQSLALLEAYPDCIKEIKDNFVVMVSGDKLVYDDGKQKDFMGRLDDSDIEDMFYDVYSLPDPKPAFQFDPGRSRSEALFKAMYGSSAEEVRKKLVDVEWIGERVKFMSVNGAADSLRAVARELTGYPELRLHLFLQRYSDIDILCLTSAVQIDFRHKNASAHKYDEPQYHPCEPSRHIARLLRHHFFNAFIRTDLMKHIHLLPAYKAFLGNHDKMLFIFMKKIESLFLFYQPFQRCP